MEQELRYERKFYLTDIKLPDLLTHIRLHPAFFHQIYYQRQVNNIYFDTPGFQSYYDNVDGSRDRVKARIRWYGNTFGLALNPTLEFKIKKGLMGYKRSFNLNSININDRLTKEELIKSCLDSLQDEKLKSYIRSVYPVLLNVYTRSYFVSGNKKVRLTVDHHLHYYSIWHHGVNSISTVKDQQGLVVELKYDVESEDYAKQTEADFPFLMTKNSKYLQGLSRVLGFEL